MLPGLTAEEGRDLIMSVGTFHGSRRLSPVEVAFLFNKAIHAGATPQTCANFVGFKGPSMIQHFLRLLRLDSSVHHLVGWKQSESLVPFIVAAELGRLNEDESTEAFKLALEHQMTRKENRQMIQLRSRTKSTVQECAAQVVRMRTQVTRKHVFIGAVINSTIKRSLAAMHQADRDALLGGVMREVFESVDQITGRLGVERFTLVTDEKGAASLKEASEDFEAIINRGLEQKVLAT